MPTRQRVAQALAGFSAGVAGRLPEFQAQLDENRKQALLEDAFAVQQHLKAGNVGGARDTLLNRIDAIQKLGGDPKDTDSLLLDIERGDTDRALQRVGVVVDHGFASGRLVDPRGVTPASTRAFESLTEGLSPEEKAKAIRINLGLVPRAVGSAEQTITEQQIVDLIANTRQRLAEGGETGKLTAQFKLKPKVESAVATAIAGATALADQAKLAKTNEAAFAVYETGMRGLTSGLDDALTGPFVGRIPALTANAQIANGTLAAMAPVLKQLFRAAGEGIFTDKDQELLLAMVPDRTTRPVAREALLENIDQIVRAKLGQSLEVAAPPPPPPPASDAGAQMPEGFENLSREDQDLIRAHLGGG